MVLSRWAPCFTLDVFPMWRLAAGNDGRLGVYCYMMFNIFILSVLLVLNDIGRAAAVGILAYDVYCRLQGRIESIAQVSLTVVELGGLCLFLIAWIGC